MLSRIFLLIIKLICFSPTKFSRHEASTFETIFKTPLRRAIGWYSLTDLRLVSLGKYNVWIVYLSSLTWPFDNSQKKKKKKIHKISFHDAPKQQKKSMGSPSRPGALSWPRFQIVYFSSSSVNSDSTSSNLCCGIQACGEDLILCCSFDPNISWKFS